MFRLLLNHLQALEEQIQDNQILKFILGSQMLTTSSIWSREIHVLIVTVYTMTYINPYRTAFPYGNGMFLHFYQQQEISTTKTVHKVINKRLKTYV